ncbi:MAG: hypothetical protein LBQ50_07250, partial [Planctomycetaceae bacterium]|nr:hypothetical protein [Planctomycetaceae bacterium]
MATAKNAVQIKYRDRIVFKALGKDQILCYLTPTELKRKNKPENSSELLKNSRLTNFALKNKELA